MVEEGSAMKAEQGAACDAGKLGEWFACWDTIEALARDADRLYAKCGANCGANDLREWRERVLAQINKELRDEAAIFQALSEESDEIQELPSASLDHAA